MIIYLQVGTSCSITSVCTSRTTLPRHLVFYSSLTSTSKTCFGHVGYLGLQKLFDKHLVDGLHVDLNTDKPDCIACTEVKLSKSPYGPTIKKFTEPGEITHVDLWGPYDVQSIYRNSYFLLMIDDASRFIAVNFLKAKSQAVQKIKDQITYLSVRDKTLCAI